MNEYLMELQPEMYLKLNAALQKKKNAARKMLAKEGVLKREGKNAFDRYTYFSEAQYKLLFTNIFSECGLELKFNEKAYTAYQGSQKQPNGKTVTLLISLFDVDTGFWEETEITGEALDKGDKSGYKAYTGALKYYLATTFMVATGDEAESDKDQRPPQQRAAMPSRPAMPQPKLISPEQVDFIKKHVNDINAVLSYCKIASLEQMTAAAADALITKLQHRKPKQEKQETVNAE